MREVCEDAQARCEVITLLIIIAACIAYPPMILPAAVTFAVWLAMCAAAPDLPNTRR